MSTRTAMPTQPAAVAASTRPARLPRRSVHGVLLLDKPLGWTSHDALQKAKNLLRAEKAGHTGTLDPLATGLLPLCFGAATKFSQINLEADKTYRATVRLGERTSTGDAEGEVTARRPVAYDAPALERARLSLLGPIRQLPPMHSALKKDGKPLYAYARAGETVEREPREVCIHRLALRVGDDAEHLEMEAEVSKGTYIRTLAEDLGEALGCGAHLRSLRRTASGPLRVEEALSIEDFLALDETARLQRLLPVDALIRHWPRVELSDSEAGRFLSGLRRKVDLPDQEAVRVFGPEPAALLGTARIRAGELIPVRLLSPPEVAGLLSVRSSDPSVPHS